MNIEVESTPIDVTPIMEPDPNWKYTCDCGVEHVYQSDDPDFEQRPGMCDYSLPTLKWVVDSEATEDYPGYGHYECKKCSEEINPKERLPSHRYYTQGKRTIRVNGKEVSEDEFQKMIDELI